MPSESPPELTTDCTVYLTMKDTEGKLTITGPRELMKRFAKHMGYNLAVLEAITSVQQALEIVKAAEKGVPN